MTGDIDRSLIDTLTARVLLVRSDLDGRTDRQIIEHFIRSALSHGFGMGDLKEMSSWHRVKMYGFFRDRNHYAGLGRINTGQYLYSACLLVRTTGRFSGNWSFIVDGEGAVLTNHNDAPAEEFEGLEAGDLINAVLASALTETIIEPSPRGRHGSSERSAYPHRRWWRGR